MSLSFVHYRINCRNSRNIEDFLYRTFEIYEVDRFVQSHLDRSDNLNIGAESLQHLVKRSIAAGYTAWVAIRRRCQSGKIKTKFEASTFLQQ